LTFDTEIPDKLPARFERGAVFLRRSIVELKQALESGLPAGYLRQKAGVKRMSRLNISTRPTNIVIVKTHFWKTDNAA
jgi:hypothetical protein